MKKIIATLSVFTVFALQAALAAPAQNLPTGDYMSVTNATGCSYNFQTEQFHKVTPRTIYTFNRNKIKGMGPYPIEHLSIPAGATANVPTGAMGTVLLGLNNVTEAYFPNVYPMYGNKTAVVAQTTGTQSGLTYVPPANNAPSYCFAK